MDKKKIEKSIESIRRQKEKHKEKINSYNGSNYALLDYWKKEIDRFDNEIENLKRKLEDE